MNLAERRALPHWVYRLYAVDGSLLYVGITYNPAQRLYGWLCMATGFTPYAWVREIDHATWRRFPNHAAAKAAEVEAIQTEDPRENLNHKVRVAA